MSGLFETKPVPEQAQPQGYVPAVSARPSYGTMEPKGQVRNFYASNKWYIWAIVLGTLIIAVLSYLAFRPRGPQIPPEAKVALTIEAPETIPSGGEAVYKIKIQNNDSQKLSGVRIDVTYSTGMVYLGSTPNALNLSGTLFDVPELISGQNAVVMVKTKVMGSVNDVKEFKAKATYRLGNYSSEFLTEQKHEARLSASNIGIELSGPAATSNVQLITYTIKYKNNSNETIKNGRLQLTYASGFQFGASDPHTDLGNNIWNVPDLAPGLENTVTVQGTYASAQPGEAKTLKAEFLILSGTGEYYIQGSASFNTQLSSLPLLVSQEVDANDYVIGPGGRLSYTIRFSNNAPVVARGVNIVVVLDGKALDLSTIQAEGASVSGGTITWNASSLSQLENLNPNESGLVAFGVDVRDPATKDSTKNLVVTSNIKIKSNEYETFFPGNQVQVKIGTRGVLDRSLSYVDGSLPPQVGKTTTYRVKLYLKNATNDISDAVVTGFLPLGAGGFQQGSVPGSQADKFQYDPSSGKFTWNVGIVAAHTGVFSETKTVEFNVQLKPAASQVGQSPTLVKDLRFQGTDGFTGLPVRLTAGELTTSSMEDQGYVDGEVRE